MAITMAKALSAGEVGKPMPFMLVAQPKFGCQRVADVVDVRVVDDRVVRVTAWTIAARSAQACLAEVVPTYFMFTPQAQGTYSLAITSPTGLVVPMCEFLVTE